VLLASKNSAKYLKDGRVVLTPAEKLFESPETIRIPGLGEFEGYPNRDSVSYRETYGIPEAGTVLRGTLRYPGWCRTLKKIGDLGLLDDAGVRDWTGLTYRDLMAGLAQAPAGVDLKTATAARLGIGAGSDIIGRLEWLGLFEAERLPITRGSALDILAARMVERLKYAEGERDMVILQHEFVAEDRKGRTGKITSTLIDFGIPGGDSSMSRTVGLTAAIGARLILEGRIRETGVRVPVTPDIYDPILDELARLGIRFEEQRRPLATFDRATVEDQTVWKIKETLPGLKEGDTLMLAVEVTDNKAGEGGPNVARSRPLRLEIVSIAEYLRYILEKREQLYKEIQAMHEDETGASTEVKAMKQEAGGTPPATGAPEKKRVQDP
jgi:saccharopine dehydrogenase-like NADP-dependent oxidoreductase